MSLSEFSDLLNQEPNPDHVFPSEDVDETGRSYFHIPIGYLEEDLRYCYGGLVQYLKTPTVELRNAVTCDVHIGVFHPILQQWLWYHGVGTVMLDEIGQGKYAQTTTVAKVNNEDAASHLAYAEGIKSACRRIGKRFGSDLNRDNAPGKIRNFKETAFEVMDKPVYDPEKSYTKVQLLNFVQNEVITVEQMHDLLAGKKIVLTAMEHGIASEDAAIEVYESLAEPESKKKVTSSKKSAK